MQFELALALGRTCAELKRTLSPNEFVQWIAFLKKYPSPSRRLDINIGWLVLWMRRCVGDKKVNFADCMLDFDKKKDNTPDGFKERAKRTALALRGMVNVYQRMKEKKLQRRPPASTQKAPTGTTVTKKRN